MRIPKGWRKLRVGARVFPGDKYHDYQDEDSWLTCRDAMDTRDPVAADEIVIRKDKPKAKPKPKKGGEKKGRK